MIKSTTTMAKRTLLVGGSALALTAAVATPASAAVDDGFSASTADGCGVVTFIDYGPGAPGGGDNDDYLVVRDLCADGHGVRADAWLGAAYLGFSYDGNGQAGAAVIWDPFGNVSPGQQVTIRACLVDGAGDTTGSLCGLASRVSADG